MEIKTCRYKIYEGNSTNANKRNGRKGLFFSINLFVYLFLTALGLCCCAQAFSSCGKQGLLFVAVRGFLIAVASRCRAQALGMWASVVVARRLSSCGTWALERRLSSCGARA